jgi:signal transduction histidine kinase/ligand-binding sensor domain-containing protein
MSFVLLLACCPCASALDPSLDINQYAHTAWTVRDGFSKGQISAITQTQDGYIWLGTDFGLLRFDGVRTVSWQPPSDQHFPSGQIFSLLTARDGTLWIGTGRGLASWKDGKLTQYAELTGHYVFKVLEDHEGIVWASGVTATIGKLCAIRNGNVQCYGEDGGLGRGAFNLYEDSKGNLWAGVKTGLWRWKPGPPKFYPLAGEPDGIQALGEDADGALLLGWKGGIYRFIDGKTEAYSTPGFARQFQATRILRDHDGGLWIGTLSHGLVHVHQGRTDVFAQSDGLSGDDVHALFQDREGNIWATTINGLDRFRDFAVATLNVNQGLSSALVQSVLADRNGSVWLSTYGGLNRWNNGQITTYDKRQGKLNGLVSNSLFQDDRGRIWVSTSRGFGYLENGQFIYVPGISGGVVTSIAQDTDGNLWIANEQVALFQLLRGNVVQQIPWSELGHKDHASALAADPSQGGLWLGFHDGGVSYFKHGQVRASYSAADGLGEGRISGFQFDFDDTVWASTASGLSRIKNGHVATLTSKNGLPCDTVNWVMEDDAHSFWLYMPCGLVRIDRAELDAWSGAVGQEKDTKRTIQVTVFDSLDGVRSLPDRGHFSPQVAKTSDGKLWFLPWDGVSVIDPRHLPLNKLPPPVHIEQITVEHKTYDAVSGMRLPPLKRDLEIDYTALSFVAPEKVIFRYKLEGFDRDWQEAGTRRQAFYTNLPPHKYLFRVIASNNSGVWNEQGDTLDFSISPAYYETNWFRGACAAVVLAMLWGVYQLRLRQLAREFSMRVETRVNERTRIARELHDTLLQSLHGLMFEFQAARNMFARNPQRAIATLDDAIHATEQAIGESRDAIGDLRSQLASDVDLAAALTATGKELTTSYNGNHGAPVFRLIVEGDQRNLSSALQDDVYRIAREVLRNAFRHAQAQTIEAEIRYDAHEFRLRIRDDGKGISPTVLAKGGMAGHWGLSGMRERAQQIGAQLKVWSEAGAGTEVQLTIPAASAYETSHGGSRFKLLRKVRSHDKRF